MSKKKKPTRKKASAKATKDNGTFVAEGARYTSPAIRFRPRDHDNQFARADIQLHGIDHSGASYEGRVFLNNRNVNAATPMTQASGYAGSFHVFGHGTCFGDAGHCDVHKDRRTRDLRSGHPLTPAFKRLTVTESLRRAARKSSSISITIVPVIRGGDAGCDLSQPLRFDHLKLVTYD